MMVSNSSKRLEQVKNNHFVIGIDGGGKKTIGVLADFKGKILKKVETGPSNPNKIGMERALFNLKDLIWKILDGYQKKKVNLAYLGLAAALERDEERKKEIEKVLQKEFPFLIKVDGDQKIAFRSGTKARDGVVLIAGSGSISMGWKGEKKTIAGGWDWLFGDQGSGFWIGKRALEEIAKSLDGRGSARTLKTLLFKRWKIKSEKDLYHKVYTPNFIENVVSLSQLVELAAKKNDKIAMKILKEGSKELAKMAGVVIRKLKFQKEKFPLVLAGSVFKSQIILREVKKEIRKIAPRAKFIRPRFRPIIGAIKLALEQLK